MCVFCSRSIYRIYRSGRFGHIKNEAAPSMLPNTQAFSIWNYERKTSRATIELDSEKVRIEARKENSLRIEKNQKLRMDWYGNGSKYSDYRNGGDGSANAASYPNHQSYANYHQHLHPPNARYPHTVTGNVPPSLDRYSGYNAVAYGNNNNNINAGYNSTAYGYNGTQIPIDSRSNPFYAQYQHGNTYDPYSAASPANNNNYASSAHHQRDYHRFESSASYRTRAGGGYMMRDPYQHSYAGIGGEFHGNGAGKTSPSNAAMVTSGLKNGPPHSNHHHLPHHHNSHSYHQPAYGTGFGDYHKHFPMSHNQYMMDASGGSILSTGNSIFISIMCVGHRISYNRARGGCEECEGHAMSVKSIFPSFSRQLANGRKMRVNEYQQLLQTSSLDRLACKRPNRSLFEWRRTSTANEINKLPIQLNQHWARNERWARMFMYWKYIHIALVQIIIILVQFDWGFSIDFVSYEWRDGGVRSNTYCRTIYVYDHACFYGGENRKRVSEWKCVLVENGNDVVASGIDCLLLLLHIGMCWKEAKCMQTNCARTTIFQEKLLSESM